jgi:hypothetical protein
MSHASPYKCDDIKEQAVRAACKAERSKKDVPAVANPDHIVIEGKAMTKSQFIRKYCMGKTFDETCVKIGCLQSMEGAKSKTGVPRF